MALTKADVKRPTLPKETVNVPELGGEVVVQGLLLKDRMELANQDGFGRLSYMLSRCVLDAAGEPIFSVDEWEVFGGQNDSVALDLFGVASRLSGLGQQEKKPDAPS